MRGWHAQTGRDGKGRCREEEKRGKLVQHGVSSA